MRRGAIDVAPVVFAGVASDGPASVPTEVLPDTAPKPAPAPAAPTLCRLLPNELAGAPKVAAPVPVPEPEPEPEPVPVVVEKPVEDKPVDGDRGAMLRLFSALREVADSGVHVVSGERSSPGATEERHGCAASSPRRRRRRNGHCAVSRAP